MDLHLLWQALIWPLFRLIASISLGLIIGNLIEALNWTRAMARLVITSYSIHYTKLYEHHRL